MLMYKEKELWTYFFSKPKNYYNQYMFAMLDNLDYIIFDKEEIEKNKSNWKEKVFGNSNPLVFEIGSGSGNFSVAMAEKFKDKNFLADEIRLKRLVSSAHKARQKNLKNIKFIRYDANNIKNIISENELSEVYINFPDPWEGNEKKRILSKDLLDNLYKLFEKGGKIFFKTDHLDYYNSVLELVNNHENYIVVFNTDDLYSSSKIEDNIKTEFEHLFINKIKTSIKYIEILKI